MDITYTYCGPPHYIFYQATWLKQIVVIYHFRLGIYTLTFLQSKLVMLVVVLGCCFLFVFCLLFYSVCVGFFLISNFFF